MKKNALLAAILLTVCACTPSQKSQQIEGHYTYEHAFNYDIEGNHLEVSETGTMDFFSDGTALDSARQVYTATLAEDNTVTWVYNYISPSIWHLDGDTLFFAGIKDQFRMTVTEGGEDIDLPQKIIDIYSGSIDHEYKFIIDTLSSEKLQWSFTYRDGHTDTWKFFRQ